MLGEHLRKRGFWVLDFLRQGKVSKHYGDIKRLIEGEKTNTELTRKNYLDELLLRATNTTEFFETYKGFNGLSDFPVISKKCIKENYGKFLSKGFKKDDLIKVKTSGSYGTPFVFYLSKEKKSRQTAEVIYFSEWANFYVGTRHAYLRGLNTKSNLKLWMQNEHFLFSRVIDDLWLESSRTLLKKKKIKVLIGFPTAIAAIAMYCHECGDKPEDFSIVGVITSSEPLLDNQRSIIESTFGCDCLSRYSTEELGVLAHECSLAKKHHINISGYEVEVLDLDEDKPARAGETGRIVVTDLFSYAMPLIRYETGDLGVLGERCSCGLDGPILERLHGRTVQSVYNTQGVRVLPFFIEDVMEPFTDIIQYQFIQDGEKEYTLKVVCPRGAYFDETQAVSHIKYWMGNDAVVNVRIVDEIEKLESGKRPYVVNNYNRVQL